MQNVTFVSSNEDGHRSEFDRVLAGELNKLGIHLNRVSTARAAHDTTDVLFYPMLESNPLEFLARAALRSLIGRRTVGFFFRPGECFLNTSLKYQIKYILFRAISRLSNVRVITLIPFTVAPRFAEVATGWVYDLQLWDLLYFGVPDNKAFHTLDRQLQDTANGRRVLMALGAQNRIKGFDYMAQIWSASQEVRKKFLFVAAGKVSEESLEAARRFEQEDGLLINRRLEDEELIHLYSRADMIWSCYTPDYNQASGIYGRAVQTGVPAVIREGSFLESLKELVTHPTLAVPYDAPEKAAGILLAWQPEWPDAAQRTAQMKQMREHSLSVLKEALAVV